MQHRHILPHPKYHQSILVFRSHMLGMVHAHHDLRGLSSCFFVGPVGLGRGSVRTAHRAPPVSEYFFAQKVNWPLAHRARPVRFPRDHRHGGRRARPPPRTRGRGAPTTAQAKGRQGSGRPALAPVVATHAAVPRCRFPAWDRAQVAANDHRPPL